MPYLSTFERTAKEEGREEGREEGFHAAVRLWLELRFGEAGLALLPRVEEINDLARLESLIDVLRRSDRIEDFEAALGVV